MFPAGADYVEALQNPTRCFQDAELCGGKVTGGGIGGGPKAISGNFASVFEVTSGASGHRYAVKCFTRAVHDQRQRYQEISLALSKVNAPWKVDFDYLPEGVRVKGTWYPALRMEWVEAHGLLDWLEERLFDRDAIITLAERFVGLVADLERARIAHGDLQHGNLLVTNDNQLRLIDYDGMFVPALSPLGAPPENGHPNYQLPGRADHHFGPRMDRFSAWVIYASLVAVAAKPTLWDQLHTAGEEKLIFGRADYCDPDTSPALSALRRSEDAKLADLACTIHELTQLDAAEVPLLDPTRRCTPRQRPRRPQPLPIPPVRRPTRITPTGHGPGTSAVAGVSPVKRPPQLVPTGILSGQRKGIRRGKLLRRVVAVACIAIGCVGFINLADELLQSAQEAPKTAEIEPPSLVEAEPPEPVEVLPAPGSLRWEYVPGSRLSRWISTPTIGDPVVGDGTVFAVVGSAVRAIDANTGEERWNRDFDNKGFLDDPAAVNSPTLAGGLVCVESEYEDVCLDAANGDRGRSEEGDVLPGSVWYRVFASGDTLYLTESLGEESRGIRAVDANSGQQRWLAGGNRASAEAVIGDAVYYKDYDRGSGNQVIGVIDAGTGRPRWSREEEDSSFELACDGTAYLTYAETYTRHVIALDSSTGGEKWKYLRPDGDRDGTYVFACTEDLLYVGGLENVRALDSSTGALAWDYPVSGTVESVVCVGNMIYLGIGDTILAVDVESRSERWRYRVDGERISKLKLAVSDDLVFYSTGRTGRLGAVTR